jgi:hypothetical protein
VSPDYSPLFFSVPFAPGGSVSSGQADEYSWRLLSVCYDKVDDSDIAALTVAAVAFVCSFDC